MGPGLSAGAVMTLTFVRVASKPANTTPDTPLAVLMNQVSLLFSLDKLQMSNMVDFN